MAQSTALAAVVDDQRLPAQTGIDVGGGVIASLPQVMQLAECLAGAATLPQAYRKPADIMAAALTAAQLRLPLMTVINGTHIINGKVTLSADLMAGVARGSGEVEEWREGEIEHGYECYARRKGGTELTVRFTLADAKVAGLSGGNWQKFPGDMCRARAISRLCRRLFPDILAGMYSPDEMDDSAAPVPQQRRGDTATGEVIEAEFEQPAPTGWAKSAKPTTEKARKGLRAAMAELAKARTEDDIVYYANHLNDLMTRGAGQVKAGGETERACNVALNEAAEMLDALHNAANEDAEQPFGTEPDHDGAPSDAEA